MEELPGSDGCFVCDREGTNPRSLGVRIFWDEDAHQSVIPFVPDPSWCGFRGIVHGGVLTALCDDAMAWSARKETGTWSVTANISVRFLKGVFSGDRYEVRGELTRRDGRKFHTQSTIRNEKGETCVEAKAVFIEVPEERLFGNRD